MTQPFTVSSSFIEDLRQKPVLLGALLVISTLLLYASVAHHEFLVFDDALYVTQNIHVNTGLNLDNVVWAFAGFHESNWHPVTWLSHMLDCQLFGLNPGPQHVINVLLHATNVLLLFLLLRRATGAVWRSFLVAALFAVHPLNVETVAWLAERKSLLCTLFSFLTIAAYGWYSLRPDWKKYLVIVVAFSLALLSKPMAVSLPIVLLFLDYWPLERYESLPFRQKWARLLLEKLPLLLMSVVSSAVTMLAQRSGGSVAEMSYLPLSLRLENAAVSYVAYIGKMLWPVNLSIFYPHPEHSLPWPDVLASTAILVAITTAVLFFQRLRYLAMGWFLFVTTLIPVIGIVQVGNQSMADRYAYIPYIGLFIIIAWGLGHVAHNTRLVPALTALCLIVAFAAATANYLQYWQDGVTLFTKASMVAGKPDFTIEESLGDALVPTGRYTEAFQHYREACILLPNYAFCHYNMAEILFHRHQLRDALGQYEVAETLNPRKDIELQCLINSGEILLDLGDYANAEMRLAAALQIDPTNSNALALRQRVLNQRISESLQPSAYAQPNY
jgi:hypothetical protein